MKHILIARYISCSKYLHFCCLHFFHFLTARQFTNRLLLQTVFTISYGASIGNYSLLLTAKQHRSPKI